MDNLQILEKREVLGKEFTIYGTKDEPLFLAKDVAKWIDHTNVTKMLNSVDEDEKMVVFIPTNQSLEGLQSNTNYTFLTEDGLYEVLMLSRKEIAKQFKKQVKVILKEIRLNGGYIATNENDSDEMIMARALVVAQRTIERKDKLIAEKENIIQKQAPKVEYTEKVLASETLINISQIAKDFGLSGTKLNKILCEEGIQYKQGRQYNLYRDYVGMNLAKSYTIIDSNGNSHMRLKWTERGRKFITELLLDLGFRLVEGDI